MGACVNIWWDASNALRAGVIVFWLVVIALYPTNQPPTHPPCGRETHLEREREASLCWLCVRRAKCFGTGEARRGEKLTRRRWRRREKEERKGGHHTTTTTYQRRRRRRRRRRRFCRCSRWSLVSFKRRQGPCSGISSLACSLRWSSFSRWRSPSS